MLLFHWLILMSAPLRSNFYLFLKDFLIIYRNKNNSKIKIEDIILNFNKLVESRRRGAEKLRSAARSGKIRSASPFYSASCLCPFICLLFIDYISMAPCPIYRIRRRRILRRRIEELRSTERS